MYTDISTDKCIVRLSKFLLEEPNIKIWKYNPVRCTRQDQTTALYCLFGGKKYMFYFFHILLPDLAGYWKVRVRDFYCPKMSL